jgi:hypothetical protein
MKAQFWNSAQINVTFTDGQFNVYHRIIALSSVTINYFLLWTIQQWVLFLASHFVNVDDCLTVLTTMVNFCSDAYRTTMVSEHLIHRQGSRARDTVESGLILAIAYAHVFHENYFPHAYDYGAINSTSGLLLLERAVLYVKGQKTYAEIFRSAIFLGSVCSSKCLQWHNRHAQPGLHLKSSMRW